jgi:crossover junction endodeoxyribonuclease RuvC
VRRLLRLKEVPQPADAADALALAICHIYQSAMRAKIGASK